MSNPTILLAQQLCKSMDSISLEQCSSVSFQKRIDRKYLIALSQLPTFLENLSNSYFVMQINNTQMHPYSTCYFDTNDFELYHDHHNGRLNRHKFRTRHYISTGQIFNEIKVKTNKNITHKYRTLRCEPGMSFDTPFQNFAIKHNCGITQSLHPQISIEYNRITLVDKKYRERLTIDLNLSYHTDKTILQYDDIGIIELKSEKSCGDSKAAASLKQLRSRQCRFSKYCFGIAQTKRTVRTNNFLPTIRLVDKIRTIKVIT